MSFETILLYALLALSVFLIVWITKLQRKIRLLTLNTGFSNLEDVMKAIRSDLAVMKEWKVQSGNLFKEVDTKMKQSIRGIETIRFNPFKGTGVGGNQSFATAFINEKGDGVVFSSLHARDRISIFSKPLKQFVSEYELSEEEHQAIEKARQSFK